MTKRISSIACGLAIAVGVSPAPLGQTPITNAPSAQAKPAAPARVPMTRYTMTAGDVTGDGIAESIVYDTDSKALRVFSHTGPGPVQTMGIFVNDVVNRMIVVDLDGDGRGELVTGEGLLGYNTPDTPTVDATIKIYKPSEKGDWSPVEIFRHSTERPEITSLHAQDINGDGQKDILFGYFESKYVVQLHLATHTGETWMIGDLPTIRMGTRVAAGDVLRNGKVMIVVGRPYGDPADPKSTTAIGDAFVLDGDTRIPLPVTRGVNAVAVGDVNGDGHDDIVLSDGWHANYGRLARCRIALITRQDAGWEYELIEDLDGHIRFDQIELVDLTGDGRPEIVGRASRDSTLGGSVRVYERTPAGWRGMTAGELVQAYAYGDFNGDKNMELVFAGQPPIPLSLAKSPAPGWDSTLGDEVETREVDPQSLVGKPAPPLKATEWMGSNPQTLAGLKGKVVMLDFWATWCQPCIEMYPEMRNWVEEFGAQGLVILGITNHSRQTSAEVRRFLARHKLPWAVAIDPRNGTHIDYGVAPIPHTFLIDRQGVVRLSHKGGGDLTKIKEKLRELLAEGPAASQ